MRRPAGELETTPRKPRQASREDRTIKADKGQPSDDQHHENPATTPTTDVIPPEDLSKLTEKETAYTLIRRDGLNHKDTCKALDITVGSGYTLRHRVKKKTGKEVRSLGLADSKYVKIAHRAIHKLARGKKVGDMETITGPVVMGAANAILDRAEPIIRKQISLNVTADVSPVDLDRYLMDGKELEGPRPQDVVIEGHHNQSSELSD